GVLRRAVLLTKGRIGVLPSTSMRPPRFLNSARWLSIAWLVRCALAALLRLELRRSGALGLGALVLVWSLLWDMGSPVITKGPDTCGTWTGREWRRKCSTRRRLRVSPDGALGVQGSSTKPCSSSNRVNRPRPPRPESTSTTSA